MMVVCEEARPALIARWRPRPGRPPGLCWCGEDEASGPCWEQFSTGRRRRSRHRLCDGFVAGLAACQGALSSGVQLEWQALTFAGPGSNKEACIGIIGDERRRWMRPALRRFVSAFWALPLVAGSSSPEEEFGDEGRVFKVLCVRRQLRAVNSAWFCSEKAQSCHQQPFSIKARAGNPPGSEAFSAVQPRLWEESLCAAFPL